MPGSAPSTPSPTRTVLVTGAGKRLGREIALALARTGCNVAVHFRQSEAEARQTAADCDALTGRPGSATTVRADLADEASVRALLPAVIAHFGSVDAVVNSASLFEHDDAASFGFAAMESHLRSNTGAAILLAQALHAHLSARDAEGTVVNLLDQKLWNLNPDFLSYTLSKAALEAATGMLALALAPPGAGGRRRAGSDADQPHADRGKIPGSAPAIAPRSIVDAAGCGGHGRLRTAEPLDHRHHAAGRRRPAPDALCARLFIDVRLAPP